MLRACCFALCLAIASSLAIDKERQIGNKLNNYEQHQATSSPEKSFANGRSSLECNTSNWDDRCRHVTLRGGTFLTNLEGTSYGPGFPPKPVGLLVRPNVSTEVSSTLAPEGRFLADDMLPLPQPPLKRRPPSNSMTRLLPSNSARPGEFQENIDIRILGSLFQGDLHNQNSTKQVGENSQENGLGVQNRAFLDSFNELDHPDPKLLSKLKGKFYRKYYAEKRKGRPKGKDELLRRVAKNEEKDENERNNFKGNENLIKPQEKEGPLSRGLERTGETNVNYGSLKEKVSRDDSYEEHGAHHPTKKESEEEEESILESDPENAGGGNKEDSEEEVSDNLSIPPTEDNTPFIKQDTNGSLENERQNFSSSREEEQAEYEESVEGEGQSTGSGEDVHSDEESNEDRDYSQENNNIDSSASPEDSEEVTYHLSEGGETSNESSQRPISSSEDTNEKRPSSNEASEEVYEDYDSREPNSQEAYSQEQSSEESPNNASNEYDEEKPPDYYDIPDYDNGSTESEYEELFSKPTKKPHVYQKRRPATFYYIVGGSREEKKESNIGAGDVENGSKALDYYDNNHKLPEESESPTESDEEHAPSGSDEGQPPSGSDEEIITSVGFDGFDSGSVLERPHNDVKTTKSPVAVITKTPMTATTKCDDTKNQDPDNQKRLKTPSGASKANTLQPGDVVSFTRARPINLELIPTAQTTTSTFQPATISAIGILKPGGSIIAKVVSPTLQVQSSSPPTKDGKAPPKLPKVPWKTILAAREATALTYLKPPPMGQAHTWLLKQARTPRSVQLLLRPL